MGTTEVSALIGSITGAISLLGIIYLIGIWKGCVDTKVNTLWNIYILDALKDRPDLARHGSPFQLTEKAEGLIPEDIKAIVSTAKTPWEMVRRITPERLMVLANGHGVTIQNFVGILVVYSKQQREGTPVKLEENAPPTL